MSNCGGGGAPLNFSALNMTAAWNSNESTVSQFAYTKAEYYRIAVPIMLVICLVSIAANAYILLAIRWLNRSPSPQLCFTLSLCAADTWMAFSMAGSFILQSYLPFVAGIHIPNAICLGLVFEAVRMGAILTSVLHLLALALNHYVGITRPLHYMATVTPELTYSLIALLWIAPPAGFFAFFSLVPGQAFRSPKCCNFVFYTEIRFRLVVSVLIFVPLLLMSLIYTHVIVVLVRRRRDRRLGAHGHPSGVRRNLKAAVTTSLILGTFLLGWMPSVVLFLLICQHGCVVHIGALLESRPRTLLLLGLAVNTLIVLKALADAVIYAARVREIRLALWLMHTVWCGCNRQLDDADRRNTLRLMSSSARTSLVSRRSDRRTTREASHRALLSASARRLRRRRPNSWSSVGSPKKMTPAPNNNNNNNNNCNNDLDDICQDSAPHLALAIAHSQL